MVTTTKDAHAALLAALGSGRVREATDGDAVAGVCPQWVAQTPGTEQVSAALRVATEHGLRVVPKGSGSKLDWGHPPRAVDLVVDLSGANEIREHAAGDLVLTAKAGTPIADIHRAAGTADQQLAIDQPLPTATVGGVIATATSGPCRYLFGGVRDLLIGITVVRADGTVTVSGGKVVKNVAGYDLGKLYTGSYGTLGVITEAVFRLHPLPLEHRWIPVTVDDPAAAAAAIDAVRYSQAMPTALEVERPEPGRPMTICAQLEGRPEATHERAQELAERVRTATGSRADVLERPPNWWGRYPFDPAGIGLLIGVAPAEMSTLLGHASEIAERLGLALAVRGAAGLGVVHAGLPGSTDQTALSELVTSLREHADHVSVLRAPTTIAEPWGPVPPGVLTLMRRTKNEFDPEHRLAPGRFVGGI